VHIYHSHATSGLTRAVFMILKIITTLLLQPSSRAISAERHNQLILNLNNKKCLRLREDDQKFLMCIIDLGDTMFRMRCCAAADESGYSSDRVKEKKAEKEEEMKKRQNDSEIETRMKNEVEVYKTIGRKEQPPRRRFTHSRCTLVTGGAICKARSCRRMTHLVRHTDAGVAFRV